MSMAVWNHLNTLYHKVDNCGFRQQGEVIKCRTVELLYLRAALLGVHLQREAREGEEGCHPIRAQRRGEVTWGGGHSCAPGL